MPKTKFQSIIFTAITAYIMVFGMTVYNTVLSTGEFSNATFLIALKSMWVEYVIIFLLAFFISSHIAKFLAFRVVNEKDRPIFIIFAIQIFTVIIQVFFAGFLAVYHTGGYNINFIPNYIIAYCKNFIFALPLQLLIAGPVTRFIFRHLFKNK